MSSEVADILDSEIVKQHVAEKQSLVDVLKIYADCRHGSVNCFCVKEARAALYPYLRRELLVPLKREASNEH